MHWTSRAAAGCFAVSAVSGAVLASGYWPEDPGWVLAGAGACALYVAVAVLLWRGVRWAGDLGIGVAAVSTALWIQSCVSLGVFAASTSAVRTALVTCGTALAASTVTLVLCCLVPSDVTRRHRLATALAGAALAPAIMFALMPAQALSVALAMGAGSALLVAGTVAVGRGRTWGLLVNLIGAAVMAVGVTFAPWLGTVTAHNPWFPNPHSILVSVLGICAAVAAAASTAVYAVPLVRFIATRDAKSN